MIPAVFGLKGIAVAAAIGCAVGAYAGYRVTDAFGEAKALRLERAQLRADLDAAKETIDRNARLTAGVHAIAIGVNRAIASLREAAGDEALIRDDPVCRYSDDEFGRLRERIDRAAAAGGLRSSSGP
ncbi:hypothetical protein [Kaistia adipata]|uniref:hypothetical protein n=1 Tax=Kaistia adipata TaxID=166954 RepID=UPI000413B367|nr:hypothetical protein [Kaistia adipata]